MLLILSVLITGAASASQSQEWNFKVFLDDRPIGYHSFRVIDRGTDQIVETEARFKVKALFIPVYSYRHQNTEVWEGNCLKKITSRTDNNGEESQISGSRGEQQFRLTTQDRRAALPLCVMPFAYWNPNFLWEERLLNSQTGDYQTVEVTPMGVDTIVVAGKSVRANYYRLTADKLHITLWYSQDNHWLALESTTEGGRKLRYQLGPV